MTSPVDYSAAERHLSRRDPVLRRLIKKVGPCTLRPHPDKFDILARSIISQQISTAAARTIGARLLKSAGGRSFSAGRLGKLTDEQFRSAGISTNKLKSFRSLIDHFESNRRLIRKLPELPDEEVIEALLPVRGVGRWTAQMFLIFCLGRLDVLPVADLGLLAGVQDLYGLAELPKPDRMVEIGASWVPYCSVATWYVWRSRGPVPSSD